VGLVLVLALAEGAIWFVSAFTLAMLTEVFL
jgi:hypothetical protein